MSSTSKVGPLPPIESARHFASLGSEIATLSSPVGNERVEPVRIEDSHVASDRSEQADNNEYKYLKQPSILKDKTKIETHPKKKSVFFGEDTHVRFPSIIEENENQALIKNQKSTNLSRS